MHAPSLAALGLLVSCGLQLGVGCPQAGLGAGPAKLHPPAAVRMYLAHGSCAGALMRRGRACLEGRRQTGAVRAQGLPRDKAHARHEPRGNPSAVLLPLRKVGGVLPGSHPGRLAHSACMRHAPTLERTQAQKPRTWAVARWSDSSASVTRSLQPRPPVTSAGGDDSACGCSGSSLSSCRLALASLLAALLLSDRQQVHACSGAQRGAQAPSTPTLTGRPARAGRAAQPGSPRRRRTALRAAAEPGRLLRSPVPGAAGTQLQRREQCLGYVRVSSLQALQLLQGLALLCQLLLQGGCHVPHRGAQRRPALC